ncbi:MAG TPA: alpha/beta hydrolase [Gaiellaceae bacterium]|nr:alpha/beta hydrolase [Gaiellaceae bacterium]
MAAAPIVLVPGFWLGGWAWDDVAAILRADGHDVTAVTLPGLESADDDRSKVTLADHVDAVAAAVESKDAPVVLAVHSGAGAPGYAVTDRVPDRIAHMVYVDSGPARGAMDPSFEADDLPLPEWDDLGENLEGISEQQLATFRERAIPQPGAAMRETHEFTNDARLDVPTTILCTSFTSDQIKAAAEEGQAWLGGVRELRNVTWVDMPTSHWPMWSRTEDLAKLLADVARDAG